MADVPRVPGVPALASFALAQFLFLTRDLIPSGGVSPDWGLYLNGEPVIVSDSVLTFDYRQSWAVADYPLEEGSFESYDKVNSPFDCRFRFATGGADEDREKFLASIASAADSLTLYDALTPEVTYQNVNIVHYDYRRTNTEGLGLLKVDVWVQEIRVRPGSTFSNVKSPNAAGTINNGSVQATPAAPAQQALVDGAHT